MGKLIVLGCVAGCLALTAPAAAHIVADPKAATAGAYQAVRFRIGHGCGARATTGVRVVVPPGMGAARPQPKPGWRLSIEREGERVGAVAWTGELPPDQFEEFAILFKLPAEAAPLRFATFQTCGDTQVAWDGSDPSHPAPTLTLTPPEGAAPHHQ